MTNNSGQEQGPQSKLAQQIQQSAEQYQAQEYQELANQFKPKPTYGKNLVGAFVVGGLISLIAQVVLELFRMGGLSTQDAGTAAVIVMIFLGALLTGLGVYDNIGRFAGAGSIIPITGFANSIVASALEFKREGFVFGVGARMFTIAGPVLVYGFVVSVLIGLMAFLWQ